MSKKPYIHIPLLILLALTLLAPRIAAAQGEEDPLRKFGQFLGEVQKYIETLSKNELGEKQLLEELDRRFKTDMDVANQCNQEVNKRNLQSTNKRYTPIYAGYLGQATPLELSALVSKYLGQDGFEYMEESSSWGTTTVLFYRQGPGKPREKSYQLTINNGFLRKTSNKIQGRGYTGDFCLIKMEKN